MSILFAMQTGDNNSVQHVALVLHTPACVTKLCCPALQNFGAYCRVFSYLIMRHGYRLKPFHVKLMGVRRSPWGTNPSDSHLEAELQQRGVFQDLPSLVGQADLIVLTCSLTDATRGMVDRTFLKACKPGVRIINVARGL